MLRNPQWNKIIYSGCRTTQLLWTDGMLTTEETGQEDGASTWEWRRFLSAGYVLSTQVKLPYSFSVILNTLTFNECIVITLLFFFLNEHGLLEKMEELNEGLDAILSTLIQACFFHTHSHMQTFMTLSYFSSLELYFKKTKQLSVINIKKNGV